MSDEAIAVVPTEDVTEKTEQVNPEASAVAETEKVGDEAAPQGTPKEGESEEQRSKRKGGWQRRIEKLERENEMLRELALSRPEKKDDKTETSAKPAQFSNPDPGDPMPDLDSFSGTLKEFNAALSAWSIRQAKREFAAEQQKREQETSQKATERKWYDAEATFADEHDDYHEVSDTAVDAIRAIEDQPGVQAIGAATTDPERGPEILYYLGQNPQEIKRLAALSPIRAAMELGKITSGLAGQGQAEKKDPPPQTKAPAPPKPVGRPKGTDNELRDDEPYKDWLKKREAQLKAKRG